MKTDQTKLTITARFVTAFTTCQEMIRTLFGYGYPIRDLTFRRREEDDGLIKFRLRITNGLPSCIPSTLEYLVFKGIIHVHQIGRRWVLAPKEHTINIENQEWSFNEKAHELHLCTGTRLLRSLQDAPLAISLGHYRCARCEFTHPPGHAFKCPICNGIICVDSTSADALPNTIEVVYCKKCKGLITLAFPPNPAT